MIPFQKYGGTSMGTAFFAQNPFPASITFETKGNRFRIRVENLTFNNRSLAMVTGVQNSTQTFESYVLNKKRNEFKKGNSILLGLSYYNQFFIEIFQTVKSNDDW